MKKYRGNTSNSNDIQKKPNIFKRNGIYKEREKSLKTSISNLKDKLEKAKQAPPPYCSDANITVIKAQLYDKSIKLEKAQKQYSKFKNRMLRIAAVLGVTLTIASASIISYANNKADEKFDNNIQNAYSMLQQDSENIRANTATENSTDLLYEQLKDDISRYVELNGQENLDNVEKKELDNIKSRIKANPEGITQLSLDILKQKIANSLGIDDFTRITIWDDSTQVRADATNPATGSITNISISLDGKSIATRRISYTLSDGRSIQESNSVPEEVFKRIKRIGAAQSNQDNHSSEKALKSVLGLDGIDWNKEVIGAVENIKNNEHKEK